MIGARRFRFGDIGPGLNIRTEMHRDGEHIMQARLKEKGFELTTANQLWTLRRHLLTPWSTMNRIYRQTFISYFKRKLSFHDRTAPLGPITVRRRPPTAVRRFFMKRILGEMAKATALHRQSGPDGCAGLSIRSSNESGLLPGKLRGGICRAGDGRSATGANP